MLWCFMLYVIVDVLRDDKAQPCAGAKRRCGIAKVLGRRPKGDVGVALGKGK
jgi:hypothetical protein